MKRVKLSEICTFSRGLTYSKSDEVDFSKNIVLRANNIDLGSNSLNLEDLRYIKDSIKVKKEKIAKKDSIIICTASGSKSHVGKVALIDEDYGYAFGGFMGQLTPTEKCLPKYLYYVLTSGLFKDFLMSLNDGTNINNLKFSDIENYEVILPSLEKQRDTVKKLDSAFAEIEKLHRNVTHIQNSVGTLLSLFISKWIDSYTDSKKVDLGELAELKGRIGWRGLTAKEYTKVGPLFLSVHSLNSGHYVDTSRAFHISQERFDESPEIHLSEGYILIAKDGAGLGKVAMVGPMEEPTTVNSSLLVVKPKVKIQTKYLYCYFLSTDFKDLVKDRLGGSTVPHLYQRDIAKIPVTFLDTEQQNDFITKFDLASILIENLSVNLERRNQLILELKQAILFREFEAA